MFKVKQILRVAVFALVMLTGVACPHASGTPFPMPDAIKPNVHFWINVFANYSTGQGIIHDNRDLDLIYDVIDLIPYDRPDPERANRRRIQAAVAEYRSILERLAKDPHLPDEKSRRVAALFKEPVNSARFSAAAARLRCQIGQKDRFEAGLIRSGAYLDTIQDIMRGHGLPEDLAYLPHVESSFNPHAYSVVGAAGMWQFIRTTGQRFMAVEYAVDERRDPILASIAAAVLLKENFERLGTWPLAITAYNHGANGMQRAKNLYGDDFARIYKYYNSPSFKFASRNFYAEFLAAREVAVNHQAYFGDLELEKPVPIKTVVLAGYAAFADLSRHFGVDPDTLKALNLALRQPIYSGQKHVPKGYALRLPAQTADVLLAAIPDPLFHSTQKPSRTYTVQKGDTASKIARMHGIKLNDLIAANHLDRSATIFPKQTLRLPSPGEQIPATTTLIAAKTASDAKEIAADKASHAAAHHSAEIPKAQTPPPFVLASITPLPAAEMPFSAPPVQIADTLAYNEQIVTATVRFERVYEHHGRRIGVIKVAVEENLGRYAGWAGVRVEQIRELNGMRDKSLLRLHQPLKIPLHRVTPDVFEQQRYEHHKRLQEDFFATYRIGDLQPYQVRRGDYYWDLCQGKFQIPLWLLQYVNPEVNLAALTVGMKLMIPSIEKASAEDADPGVTTASDLEEIVPLPLESAEDYPVT